MVISSNQNIIPNDLIYSLCLLSFRKLRFSLEEKREETFVFSSI